LGVLGAELSGHLSLTEKAFNLIGVGSIYETAFTIATIGSDESLAEEWINHADPTQTFRRSLS
jgi:hypothetical protein